MMPLRPLIAGDAAAFRALRLEGLRQHPEAFGASYEIEARQPVEQAAERLASGRVWGGFDAGGALAGLIGLRLQEAPKIRHIATIWGMYVVPAQRGSGLARRLLDAAIEAARPECRSCRLSVVSSNLAARRLYERAGFTAWALEREALCVEGVFHDELLMRLDFS